MEFAPMVALAALVFSVINFLKFVTAKDVKSAVSQAIVWVAGVAAVTIAAHTDFASGISVADRTLDTLNAWSLVFVGLSWSSIATVANEAKKALDGNDTAAKPPLIP